MHARRSARDVYFPERKDDTFFSSRGDVVLGDAASARTFASRINMQDARSGSALLGSAELAAMALMHEILHAVLDLHRKKTPSSFARLFERLTERLGGDARGTLERFLRTFPTPSIYAAMRGDGDETPERLFAREGARAEDTYAAEVVLLWLTNQNPAYEPVRALVSDADLGTSYAAFIAEARAFFAQEPSIAPGGENLVDLLLAPARHAPSSIFAQLKFVEEHWGVALGLDRLDIWKRLLWMHDFVKEEERWFFRGGPGPGEPLLDPMRFGRSDEEPKRFSEDRDWMPRVVLVAKTVYVWLDQLSKKYERAIERLDQIPNEELALLASRGFSGLWLIGLFERSLASRKIKQMRGDHDAVASAYSLKSYTIADDLGGHAAYEDLARRAWENGLRLAADMVPNHVGIDADWVMQHPDWFVKANGPPFPSYRFGREDLSEDSRVGVFLEEGYWDNSDAAVVFRRHDRWSGSDTFIYHGNDGTSMPWNDTAQLDYTKPEVRHAVIETILHVARMFPIIRFDAAMTLAKRHFQRLWFPLPGHGGAIPSRADYAMTQDAFDSAIPVEFWREVVDTVAARAPDTLLLAEAFWMMEGYFVRSLGMHRVYNSAFMNMLKREENAKYRETIRNVLDFEPEILKRFVNFMNNPDEDTAIAQFGTDDKYFGVCTLMSTMPGLPMFGHGQVEGLTEKYGMEFRRPKRDELPNEALVARHEREIFPLLKMRSLFSGVENFALFDFERDDGGVDEDVFAYANREGDQAALVLYHNKFKDTRGRVRTSVGNATRSVGALLGLSRDAGEFLIFRDWSNDVDYVRPMTDVVDGGVHWELGAFKYHVLSEFRAVWQSERKPYAKLWAEIGTRGVASIESALEEIYFRPVHAPLREALGEGHVAYLVEASVEDGAKALVERLGHVADGIAYLEAGERDAERETEILEEATKRYRALKASDGDAASLEGAVRWIEIEAVLAMVDEDADFGLEHVLGEAPFATSALEIAPVREMVAAAMKNEKGRRALGIHEAGGTAWIVKERLDDMLRLMAERAIALGTVSVALAKRQVSDVARIAEKVGYRAKDLAAALALPLKPSSEK